MPERGGADVLSDSCGAESRECMHAQGTGIDATRRDLACTDTGRHEVDTTRHATCAGNESSGRREVQEERRERHGRPARPGPRFPLCTRGAAAFRVRVVVVVDSALRARNWMRRRRGGLTCTLVVVCMQSRRSADGPGRAPEIRANGRKGRGGSRGVLGERLRGGESELVKRSQCEDEDGRREFAAARRVRLV
ncbi:hypothetical protein C8R43DRAFT_968790 [Mycena crocata]|nr:hypothetical protein C8R43DRAFT_968790 [Mycena crocata]